jgi:hypothetical protein
MKKTFVSISILFFFLSSSKGDLIVEAFASPIPMTEQGVYDRTYDNSIFLYEYTRDAYFSVRVSVTSGEDFKIYLGDYTIERDGLPTEGPTFFTGLLFTGDKPLKAAWDSSGTLQRPNSGSIYGTTLNVFTVTNLEVPFFPIDEIGESGSVTWNFTATDLDNNGLSGVDTASISIIPEPSSLILVFAGLISALFYRKKR